jgi:dihydrofolate reductase
MRQLTYSVAMSLDGYIAGPNGEYDWIITDPSVDFGSMFKRFDVLVMGRKTFELALKGPGANMPGMQTVVCSRTLRAADHPGVVMTADAATTTRELKSKPGKELWLFGGAALFRSLLDAGLVDGIEVSVMPILLSKGIPLLPPGGPSPKLKLVESKTGPSSIVRLSYQLAIA